jgi:hypothetical protein
MDVMHERWASLDVHKATVIACVRLMTGGKVKPRVPDVRYEDRGFWRCWPG